MSVLSSFDFCLHHFGQVATRATKLCEEAIRESAQFMQAYLFILESIYVVPPIIFLAPPDIHNWAVPLEIDLTNTYLLKERESLCFEPIWVVLFLIPFLIIHLEILVRKEFLPLGYGNDLTKDT